MDSLKGECPLAQRRVVVLEEDQDGVLSLRGTLLIQLCAGFQALLQVLLTNSVSRANPSTAILVMSHDPSHIVHNHMYQSLPG